MTDQARPLDAPPSGVKGAQTLDRGLDLLERVAREPMRIADLAERAGLSRGTAARLSSALVDRGFLAVAGRGQLRAGPKLIQLASDARAQVDLSSVARPHLQALAARTGLCSFLGRRDGDWSVHMHRSQGSQRLLVATPLGTRRMLPETSLGRALFLDDDAASWQRVLAKADPAAIPDDWEEGMRGSVARGVVIHRGPPPDSIRSIAAPVRDASGGIAAAISIATVAPYLEAEGMEALAPIVRETADAISRGLGWQGPEG